MSANPTAALSTALLLLLLMLAALHLGQGLGADWAALRPEEAEMRLDRLWFGMQVFWLLAALAPVGIAVLGQIPPGSTLLPFRLRTPQIFTAEVSAALLDTPVLIACALTLPIVLFLLGMGKWLQACVTLISFGFLSLQTGLCARLLAYLGALGARRLRRLAAVPGMTALLFLGLCAGMPPAFASLTTTAAQHFLPSHLPAASSSSAHALTAVLPSHIAARAVIATRQGDYASLAGSFGSMAACLLLTGGTGLWALRRMERGGMQEEGARVAARQRRLRPTARSQAGPLRQVEELVRTEWRLLLRTPQNYLPLRRPAAMLLLGAFALLAPDMGKNPVDNLKELLAIGSLLYSLLWQLQFLCNRFGSESGTGALLFGFSIPRRRLLLGKNIALFGLLLLVDSPILVGMAFVSEVPERIGLFLMWLPLILLTLTSLGNIVSALQPFSIRALERRTGPEPPDGLTGAYLLIGSLAIGLLMGVGALTAHGIGGWIAAALVLTGLYAASLQVASRLLTRREYAMISATSHFS